MGQGDIYVQLTKSNACESDVCKVLKWNDDSDFEPDPFSQSSRTASSRAQSHASVHTITSSPPKSNEPVLDPEMPGPSSTPRVIDLTEESSSDCDSPPMVPLIQKKSKYDDVENNVDSLHEMFPNYSKASLENIMVLCGGNVTLVTNLLLGGEELGILPSELSQSVLTGGATHLVVDGDSFLSEAIAYYKWPTVDMRCPIYVEYRNSPAVDAGGPERQFFGDVL